ncbi:MAG: DEAD/DEAH box helicase, partial [SAR324 cluster bacterium]|nr:DEAD/DEAH box helicase [SAR324 cluster bacterium]
MPADALRRFHPAVAAWFLGRFGAPTAPQREGWPAIRAGRHTLISAPTGSGKTLAAFLAALDDLVQRSLRGGLETATQVLYVSPLKALSADVEKNLQEPLTGIAEALRRQGLPSPGIRVLLRTGDTPSSQRAAMIKRPPHILVTTPESLFILLTSERGRAMLSTVRTVIVDEIHALMGNKRGSHLALSLERLEALTLAAGGDELVRIGLSATQKPIDEVANFLVGTGACAGRAASPRCTVVDTGHVRRRDLAIEVPPSPLEAVMSGEVWAEVYQRLGDLIEAHRTTLVFVNTRRLAERVARHLSERLGEASVGAHHGSMAKEQRLEAEQRLKAGQLRVLVATASLELGIDVGAIDLVCQLGCTKSIAAFLQRVGRSGHTLGGLPKGRLFPLTRDELAECAALLDAVRREELDRLVMPEKPLDILAQHIVAATACEDWGGEALWRLIRRAWPYRQLDRAEFDAVVDMLVRGFRSGRGRHGAYLHHDAVNDRLRGRRGARHAAIVSGGAIPDTAAYDVVLEPAALTIGSVDEDFAMESLPGDIFQLGNTSWRILRVETGRVRVEDAHGLPPTIPFWVGEAPGRSDELSWAVSRLREEVADKLGASDSTDEPHLEHGPPADKVAALASVTAEGRPAPAAESEAPAEVATTFVQEDDAAVRHLVEAVGMAPEAAVQLAEYLASAKAALGVMPTQSTLVVERFFDESGGMQLVIHSPFGSRLNRAWGLALRKRFCRTFNFELQAAATEDAIVLSLGPTHSFQLAAVFHYLNSASVRQVLVQALLDAPMFTVRWRQNANRALAVLRRYGGKKVPAPLQRIRADDLLALVFPDQQACLENIVGEREIPDHPLVHQTLRDCLEEAMDIAALERLLRAIEEGGVRLVTRELSEPSSLAQEILHARPYAFLDDAPLEERRTRLVHSRRWLDPETAANLAALDHSAIAQVRAEAWPEVGSADELHDALMLLGVLTETEGRAGSGNTPVAGSAAQAAWLPLLAHLGEQGRAAVLTVPSEQGQSEPTHSDPGQSEPAPSDHEQSQRAPARFWVAAEWLPQLRALYPDARLSPPIAPPRQLAERSWSAEEAVVELLRARLEASAPVTANALANTLCLTPVAVEAGLLALEGEGFVLRGRFTPGTSEEEWCERGLLARIHRYTLNRLRREIEPVSSADFLRFLFAWQRVDPRERVDGLEGLAAVVELLEGFEAPAAAWEEELFAARMVSYDREWLDRLCAMGRVAWLRLSAPAGPGGPRNGAQANAGHEGNGGGAGIPGAAGKYGGGRARRGGPVATTPVALLNRRNMAQWLRLGPAV